VTTASETPQYRAVLLTEEDPGEHRRLNELRADARIEFLDQRTQQRNALRLRDLLDPRLFAEPTRWAYYPWRRTVVGILGPIGYCALRLADVGESADAGRQRVLRGTRVGVTGLRAGPTAEILAMKGVCGAIKLADFGASFPETQCLHSSALDFGLDRAVAAARAIAEVDPYVWVEVIPPHVAAVSIDDFLDDFLDELDVVVEGCSSLGPKLRVHTAARDRRVPVLAMNDETGSVVVQRYDLEPQRAILSNLIANMDPAKLVSEPVVEHISPETSRGQYSPDGETRTSAARFAVNAPVGQPFAVGSAVAVVAAVDGVRSIALDEPSGSDQEQFTKLPADDAAVAEELTGDLPSTHHRADS
jgi:molybdopterin/thiamine biosynthesis adenylyltransferase